MNKIQILGTMVRDCELKYTNSGVCIGSFSIAHNSKYKDATGNYVEKVSFFDVTTFSKTAENISKFFHKGSRILIDGELDYQSWEKDGQKRSKVGIKVNSFDFIDRKQDTPQQNNQPQTYQPPPSQPAPTQDQQGAIPSIDINEEEIPFAPMNWRL